MTITDQLAKFIKEIQFEDLPDIVIEKAKENILDTLGSALASANTADISNMIKEIKKYDSQNNCTIWGSNKKASLFNATLINGTMGHTLEMDDVHKQSKCHSGTVVIPAALTFGEFNKISGKDLLLATIIGYEIILHIGIGIGATSHRLRGWHATSTCGPFGAAAVVSKILGQEITKIKSALGIAGTQASGLWAFTADGATSKKYHSGHAAYCGIIAAIMANSGMIGPSQIIEAADGGFFRASSENYNYEAVTNGLGKKYEILNVDQKPYACCRSMHPSINAVLELKREKNLSPQNIERIEVKTYDIAIKQCGLIHQPKNIFESKFSIPFGIAVALFEGNALNEQFSMSRINNKEIINLAKKVKVAESKKYTEMYPDNWSCRVKIITKNKEIFEKEILKAKGDHQNPLSREELISKFNSLTKKVFNSETQQRKVVEIVDNLENIKNIQTLLDLLSV